VRSDGTCRRHHTDKYAISLRRGGVHDSFSGSGRSCFSHSIETTDGYSQMSRLDVTNAPIVRDMVLSTAEVVARTIDRPLSVGTPHVGKRRGSALRADSPLHLRELAATKVRGPSFLDLFSGSGGLSLGLLRAGWTPLGGIDHWQDAVDTYNANLPDACHRFDINDVRAKDLSRILADSPEWIVGGPPCQGYSTIGKRNRADDRNRLFLQFRRIVKELRPKGFMIENVLGLKDMSFEEEVSSEFQRLGYTVEFMVLTAADFGVPQLRRRVVFVGRRDGGRFLGPEVSVMPDQYTSVADAIGDLPALKPGESATAYLVAPKSQFQRWARGSSVSLTSHEAASHPTHLVEAISHIPDGGNRRSIPDALQPRSGFHNSYSRLASWLPAVAVTQNMSKPSGTRCVHPFQDRGLTAREGARLQAFPDSFRFTHGAVSQRLQIANAVPPLLAEKLGRALVDPHRWV
jgi:DNA (cytosine-5)-methyltransferase 1